MEHWLSLQEQFCLDQEVQQEAQEERRLGMQDGTGHQAVEHQPGVQEKVLFQGRGEDTEWLPAATA
jgi:hypothetical protein